MLPDLGCVLEKDTMAKLEFELELLSPLFSYGADQSRPEIRAASVRGQLRYWMRAIAGAYLGSDLKELWRLESSVFGSTGVGSGVQVRVITPDAPKTKDVEMLPHRSDKRASALAIAENTRFTVVLATRPGQPLPHEAADAMALWLLIGGLGKRSRRIFGAVQLSKPLKEDEHASFAGDIWHETWSRDIPQIKTYISALKNYTLPKKLFNKLLPVLTDGAMPTYPTLHPQASRIVVCKEQFNGYLEANESVFGKLRSKRFKPDDAVYQAAFGGVGKERRASPLHVQVRRFGGKYHLVLTAMRSQSRGEKRRWDHLNDFMDSAKEDWDGEDVWGKLI
jgi:CRISPR-associated protein Cmr1